MLTLLNLFSLCTSNVLQSSRSVESSEGCHKQPIDTSVNQVRAGVHWFRLTLQFLEIRYLAALLLLCEEKYTRCACPLRSRLLHVVDASPERCANEWTHRREGSSNNVAGASCFRGCTSSLENARLSTVTDLFHLLLSRSLLLLSIMTPPNHTSRGVACAVKLFLVGTLSFFRMMGWCLRFPP